MAKKNKTKKPKRKSANEVAFAEGAKKLKALLGSKKPWRTK
jgi:hypothetical protein